MPEWIHNRANRIMESTQKEYGKEKGKQIAFALATQQAHATGKAPNKWHGKPFGTPEGKREAKAKYDEPSKMRKTALGEDFREELDPRDLEALRAFYGVRGRDVVGRAGGSAMGSGLASAGLSGLGTHSAEGALAGLAAGGALGGLYGLGSGIYDRVKTERALKKGELPDFSPSLVREVLLPSLAAGGTVGLISKGLTENNDVAVQNALLSSGITGLAGLVRYGLMRKAMRDQERAMAKAGADRLSGSLEDQILPAVMRPSQRDFEKAAGIFGALFREASEKKNRKPSVAELQPSEGKMGLGPPVSSGTGITQMGSAEKRGQAFMTPQGPVIVPGTPPPVMSFPPTRTPGIQAPSLIPVSMMSEDTPITPPAASPVPPPLPVASVVPGATGVPHVEGAPQLPQAPKAPQMPPPVSGSAAAQSQEPTRDSTTPKTPPSTPKKPPSPEKSTLAPQAQLTINLPATKKAQDESAPLRGLDREVVEFLAENPDPSDEELHEWAESRGYNVPRVEEAIYQLATKFSLFSEDGRSNEKGVSPEDVDPEQLSMGVNVEHEHTPDDATARRIALDHLAELPDYYTRLKRMETAEKAAGALRLVPHFMNALSDLSGRNPVLG